MTELLRQEKRHEFHRIVVLREKHATRYIDAPHGTLGAVCCKIVEKRNAEGYWYEGSLSGDEPLFLKEALAGNGQSAHDLLDIRSDAEYEDFEVEILENLLPA